VQPQLEQHLHGSGRTSEPRSTQRLVLSPGEAAVECDRARRRTSLRRCSSSEAEQQRSSEAVRRCRHACTASGAVPPPLRARGPRSGETTRHARAETAARAPAVSRVHDGAARLPRAASTETHTLSPSTIIPAALSAAALSLLRSTPSAAAQTLALTSCLRLPSLVLARHARSASARDLPPSPPTRALSWQKLVSSSSDTSAHVRQRSLSLLRRESEQCGQYAAAP
jgi:hypothetical protein